MKRGDQKNILLLNAALMTVYVREKIRPWDEKKQSYAKVGKRTGVAHTKGFVWLDVPPHMKDYIAENSVKVTVLRIIDSVWAEVRVTSRFPMTSGFFRMNSAREHFSLKCRMEIPYIERLFSDSANTW